MFTSIQAYTLLPVGCQGLNLKAAPVPVEAQLIEAVPCSNRQVAENTDVVHIPSEGRFAKVESFLNQFLINAIGSSYVSCIPLLMVPSLIMFGAYMQIVFGFLCMVGAIVFIAENLYHGEV